MATRKTVQVLLVDDDRPSRILMERELAPGAEIGVTLAEGQEVLDELAGGSYDVVLRDLELPDQASSRPLRLVRGSGHGAEAVVVSSQAQDVRREIQPAVEEAHGFLTRPVNPALLNARGVTPAQGAPPAPPRPLAGIAGASKILGQSPPILDVLRKVERIAASSASVLIQGETGTGKTMVARAIHEASPRKNRPFVVVNCSAFQETLLESELFGHEKGAFTGAISTKPGLFEVAHGGTLFLDEVAEMSPSMQAKLLQVLDAGEFRRVGGTKLYRVDNRIVGASNKDLPSEVKAGRFREDLLFRLKVVTLVIPPLRERREDIPGLAEHFLARFNSSASHAKSFAPATLRLLSEYRWPGNVRELANVVEGLVLLTLGDEIGPQDLPPNLRPAAPLALSEIEAPLPMAEIERLHIQRTLGYTEGRKAQAARLLGIDVKTLNSKIRGYGLEH